MLIIHCSHDNQYEKNNEDKEENNQARRKAKEGRRHEGLDPLRLEEIFALEQESNWSSEFGSYLLVFAKLLSSQSILTLFLIMMIFVLTTWWIRRCRSTLVRAREP